MLTVTFVGIIGDCFAFLSVYHYFLISNMVNMYYFCGNHNTKKAWSHPKLSMVLATLSQQSSLAGRILCFRLLTKFIMGSTSSSVGCPQGNVIMEAEWQMTKTEGSCYPFCPRSTVRKLSRTITVLLLETLTTSRLMAPTRWGAGEGEVPLSPQRGLTVSVWLGLQCIQGGPRDSLGFLTRVHKLFQIFPKAYKIHIITV